MTRHKVAIVRYQNDESIKNAIEMAGAFSQLTRNSKVFIKPNVVFWTRRTDFPKYGVITTSRVVENVVRLLKDLGINDITIGEGITTYIKNDFETAEHAFESLGYNVLKKRYGIKIIDVFQRPFKKVKVNEEIDIKVNSDVLENDVIINLPVLKTHAQTKVSLGIKNLKGFLDIGSRKKCHNPDLKYRLDWMVSGLPLQFPPTISVLDGIFTMERGPLPDGKARRSNLLIASRDLLSADIAGAMVLGYRPEEIEHLGLYASHVNRTIGTDDMELIGEPIEDVKSFHEYAFPYNEAGTLPAGMAKMGIRGISYPKYDSTICTYCSQITSIILLSVAQAWKGEPWDDIEVLTGKVMNPSPGKKKTVLLGQCMYNRHRGNPDINGMIAVRGCPPDPGEIIKALHSSGIEVNPEIIKNFEMVPGQFLGKYRNKPEFNDAFFRISKNGD